MTEPLNVSFPEDSVCTWSGHIRISFGIQSVLRYFSQTPSPSSPPERNMRQYIQKSLYSSEEIINNLCIHLTILTFKIQCYFILAFPVSHHRWKKQVILELFNYYSCLCNFFSLHVFLPGINKLLFYIKNQYCCFNILIISKYLEGIIPLKHVYDFQ